jgi:hypothetical protein
VGINSLKQVARAAVMQEKQALPDAPQRDGSELVRPGGALDDVVGEPGTHMVHQQVGEQVRRAIL